MKDLNLKHKKRAERDIKMLFGKKRWDGVYVAGGAARAYVLNKPYRDIDFMFRDEKTFSDFVGYLQTEHGALVTYCRDNLVDLRLNNIFIQCCAYGWFQTPWDAIDDFDFTCCKFALDQDFNTYYTKADFEDAVNLTLRTHRLKYPLIVFRRIEKYISEGYTPYGKEFWTDLCTKLKPLDDMSNTRWSA